MSAVVRMMALVAAAFGLLAAIVFGLGDRRTFVSPPEAVVENVVRALQLRRFPQTLEYFTADARARVSPETVADATRRLESRIGRIEEVTGEPGWIAGEVAGAVALIRTDRNDAVRVPLRLHRENGEWRLPGMEGLAVP